MHGLHALKGNKFRQFPAFQGMHGLHALKGNKFRQFPACQSMHGLHALKGNKFRQFPAISLLFKKNPLLNLIYFRWKIKDLHRFFLEPFEWQFT